MATEVPAQVGRLVLGEQLLESSKQFVVRAFDLIVDRVDIVWRDARVGRARRPGDSPSAREEHMGRMMSGSRSLWKHSSARARRRAVVESDELRFASRPSGAAGLLRRRTFRAAPT